MPSPTYAKNKVHQYKWIEKNREQFNLNRRNTYYRNKSPYYRESEIFRRILLEKN
jgi:hypothetical protein